MADELDARTESQTFLGQPKTAEEIFLERNAALPIEAMDLLDLTPYGIFGLGVGAVGVKGAEKTVQKEVTEFVKAAQKWYVGKEKMVYKAFPEDLVNRIYAAEGENLGDDTMKLINSQFHKLGTDEERAIFLKSLEKKYPAGQRSSLDNFAKKMANNDMKAGTVMAGSKAEAKIAIESVDAINARRITIAQERIAIKDAENFLIKQKPLLQRIDLKYGALGKFGIIAAVVGGAITATFLVDKPGESLALAGWAGVEGTDYTSMIISGVRQDLDKGLISPQKAKIEADLYMQQLSERERITTDILGNLESYPTTKIFRPFASQGIRQKLEQNVALAEAEYNRLTTRFGAQPAAAADQTKFRQEARTEGPGAFPFSGRTQTGSQIDREDIIRFEKEKERRGITTGREMEYIRNNPRDYDFRDLFDAIQTRIDISQGLESEIQSGVREGIKPPVAKEGKLTEPTQRTLGEQTSEKIFKDISQGSQITSRPQTPPPSLAIETALNR